MTLKIAVFAPIPSASVSTAIAAKAGRLSKLRIAYRRSLTSVSIVSHPFDRRLVDSQYHPRQRMGSRFNFPTLLFIPFANANGTDPICLEFRVYAAHDWPFEGGTPNEFHSYLSAISG